MSHFMWLFADRTSGVQKGPIGSTVLRHMLQRGLGGVDAATLVWNTSDSSTPWQPICNVPYFADVAALSSALWYIVDSQEGQRSSQGPFASRDILRRLTDGHLNIDSLVCSSTLTNNAWRLVKEVPQLLAAYKDTLEQAGVPTHQPQSAEIAFDQTVVSIAPINSAASTLPSAHKSSSTGVGGRKLSKEERSTWVYVSGLPVDGSLTEAELAAHMSRVGLLAMDAENQRPWVKLYMDANGKAKGDASVCYFQLESVDLALKVLDGGYLRAGGAPISVQRAGKTSDASRAEAGVLVHAGSLPDGRKEQTGNAKAQAQAQVQAEDVNSEPEAKRRKKEKPASHARVRTAQQVVKAQLSWDEDDIDAKHGGGGGGVAANLKIIILENLFRPGDLIPTSDEVIASLAKGEEPRSAFESKLENDVAVECSKVGEVEKITLFSQNPRGVIAVKFRSASSAQTAVKVLQGRVFGKENVRCFFYDGETDYTGTDGSEQVATREESLARLDTFGTWLDRSQDALPEELQLRTED